MKSTMKTQFSSLYNFSNTHTSTTLVLTLIQLSAIYPSSYIITAYTHCLSQPHFHFKKLNHFRVVDAHFIDTSINVLQHICLEFLLQCLDIFFEGTCGRTKLVYMHRRPVSGCKLYYCIQKMNCSTVGPG
jgi:hypothetical protein